MTEKELLYMTDGISHEKNLKDIISYASDLVEDEDLATFLGKIAKKHQSCEEKLLKIMEDEANE